MTLLLNGEDKIKLLRSSAEKLAELESQFGTTQSAVVDDMIEDSCWSDKPELQSYVGGKGSAEQRLQALLAALAADEENMADKCAAEWQVRLSQAELQQKAEQGMSGIEQRFAHWEAKQRQAELAKQQAVEAAAQGQEK